MSVEYQHSILWRGQDPTKIKFTPKHDGTKKVGRHFAGQQPAWVEAEKKKAEELEKKKDANKDLRQAKRRRETSTAAVIVEDAGSSRLKRLQAASAGGETSSERLLRHRVVHDAAILESTADDKGEDDLDEDGIAKKEDVDGLKGFKQEGLGVAELAYDQVSGSEEEDNELRALRRDRARDLALQRRKIEEDVLKAELEDEAEDELEEEASEYESESEENDPRRGIMMKPVFVSKTARETVLMKELIEQEEAEADKKKELYKLEKKADSKSLVIEKIQEEVDADAAKPEDDDRSDIELMDDDDEKNEAEEYEMWKIRELKRIKRDKEERVTRQKEIEFILKRRGMTDEERAADDKRLDEINPKRDEVKNFGFMQKYYHRGGFFQDKAVTGEEELYLRDYHEPLEEEKYDKSLLPQAMQLRRGQFGKKGQVKHSHLTSADTTDMTAAWAQSTKQIQRYQEKMAGASGVNSFDRPKGVGGITAKKT